MSNLSTTGKRQILVVDDELAMRRSLAILLGKEQLEVLEADSLSAAVSVLAEKTIDLVITDLRIGDENGLDLIKIVKERHPDVESVLITAFGSIESAVRAMQAGAADYLTKPFSNHELLLRVNKALERKTMREEIITLRQHVAMSYGFDNIVGISKKIAQLKETAMRIAPTDITTLITGASGTGKELFARAVHHHSHRRNGPLITIDCSAIPETLLESELFGHIKGSFTSATQTKKGLFEAADGGTIFLDEVANMPQSTQVKLLRFLQNSEIRPVGASVSRKVNVRTIAACNRDLAIMVKDGEFREDLYYRLNVIPLHLPTLVERSEDIEILTEYFLRTISMELGRGTITISRQAVDKLLSHSWPGNIRELENTLRRGAALATSTRLENDDIMFVTNECAGHEQPEVQPRTTLRLKGNSLDNGQRSLIIRALNEHDWNYTKTAAELGIGRTTLWRKIKKYDLQRELVTE
ncbi:MAG: sigma-54 dependent transcriptional regulator [candidate division Zixibacteria bacterium]|nr:sigma-54 dependent transcriptional regulator [candidate division Zixibacteria bacterium]